MLESEPQLSPPPNPLHPPLFPLTHAPSNSLPLGLFLHTAHTHVHTHSRVHALRQAQQQQQQPSLSRKNFLLSLSSLIFLSSFRVSNFTFFLPSLAQFATSNATQCAHTHTHTLAFSLFLSLSLSFSTPALAHRRTHTLVLVERKR